MLDLNSHTGPRVQRVRVVRELDRASFRTLAFYAAVCFLFALLALVYGWGRQTLVARGYGIEQLKAELAEAEEVGRRLQMERAALRSPQRIDAYARQYLGLVPPPSHQIIFSDKKASARSQGQLLALGQGPGAQP